MSAQAIDGVGGRRPAGPSRRLRGGSGLGDSIYLRPICEAVIRQGEKLTVMSNFPGVFIGSGATVEPFRRDGCNMIAHYVGGKMNPTTTLWQDMCAHCGITAPLSFAWTIQNRALVFRLREKAAGRPIVIVHGGREPMGRRDKFGIELLPERAAFTAALAGLGGCYTVRVGMGDQLYPLAADIDLSDKTSVSDLLDVATVAAGIVAQCSFAVPLAEVFDKPFLGIWAARGLVSRNDFIRTVTPSKILSKPTSGYVVDDWPAARITEAASTFIRV